VFLKSAPYNEKINNFSVNQSGLPRVLFLVLAGYLYILKAIHLQYVSPSIAADLQVSLVEKNKPCIAQLG
jgi:hypothetical protein